MYQLRLIFCQIICNQFVLLHLYYFLIRDSVLLPQIANINEPQFQICRGQPQISNMPGTFSKLVNNSNFNSTLQNFNNFYFYLQNNATIDSIWTRYQSLDISIQIHLTFLCVFYVVRSQPKTQFFS